jgi:hypothetical protein
MTSTSSSATQFFSFVHEKVTTNIAALLPQKQEKTVEKLELIKNEDLDDEDLEQQVAKEEPKTLLEQFRDTVAIRLGYNEPPMSKKKREKQPMRNKEETQPVEPSSSWSASLSEKFNALKQRVGLAEPEPPTTWMEAFSQEMNGLVSLTATQRMYGFAICFVLGAIMVLISLGFLPSILLPPAMRAFALFYTIGSLLVLTSTFFIIGPIRQLKLMFTSERIVPSLIYIVSMLLTLLVVLELRSVIFVILLLVIQVIALGWYILTYIPFGQSFMLTTIRGLLSTMW